MIYDYIVSWEPEGRYCSSEMFRWEPEGCYCCTTKYMAIVPFWFSKEHGCTAVNALLALNQWYHQMIARRALLKFKLDKWSWVNDWRQKDTLTHIHSPCLQTKACIMFSTKFINIISNIDSTLLYINGISSVWELEGRYHYSIRQLFMGEWLKPDKGTWSHIDTNTDNSALYYVTQGIHQFEYW